MKKIILCLGFAVLGFTATYAQSANVDKIDATKKEVVTSEDKETIKANGKACAGMAEVSAEGVNAAAPKACASSTAGKACCMSKKAQTSTAEVNEKKVPVFPEVKEATPRLEKTVAE